MKMHLFRKNILTGLIMALGLNLYTLTISAQEVLWFRPRVVSPEIHQDKSVTFRILAPEADHVALHGAWMETRETKEDMVKNDTGLWSLTVGPLEPDIYIYAMWVNGVKTLDEANALVMRDGIMYDNMLLVPGPASDLYAVHDVPHGTVRKVWYDSPTLGMRRRMYVYTPANYEGGYDTYPVFYLLHGGGGDEDTWTTLGRCCQIMDNLIAARKARPMIVVMTNGNPTEAASPGEGPPVKQGETGVRRFSTGSGLFERSLVDDVIPFVEEHYRTKEGKSNRAVAGLSMGGVQTMNLAFDHSMVFDYYGVMSAGISAPHPDGRNWFPNLDARMNSLKVSGYKLFWIGCGTDDFGFESVENLVSKLEEAGMEYTFMESSGEHTWSNWRLYLSELAPLLFR